MMKMHFNATVVALLTLSVSLVEAAPRFECSNHNPKDSTSSEDGIRQYISNKGCTGWTVVAGSVAKDDEARITAWLSNVEKAARGTQSKPKNFIVKDNRFDEKGSGRDTSGNGASSGSGTKTERPSLDLKGMAKETMKSTNKGNKETFNDKPASDKSSPSLRGIQGKQW